ncbi:MAG: HAD hydrolase-like protein [Spirochaetes bacterium]|nr:HAD hydrolase-like protein [Spirochaetota bacterium]
MKDKNIYLAFDIDGTIFDAGEILLTAIEQGSDKLKNLRPELNISTPTMQQITSTLGYPLPEIFRMLYPELDAEGRRLYAEIWTENLVSLILARKGILIDGAERIIPQLHAEGFTMLVASNGAREYVEAVLAAYNLKKYFSEPFLYAADGYGTKSGIVKEYMKVLEPGTFIMIGDRITDLDAARDNSIPFIGCAFGHAGIEEIGGEKYIVHGLDEVPGMVKRVLEEV